MGIPINKGDDVFVVPLTDKWNKNYLPMEANSETAVPLKWFEGGSVDYVVPNPRINREADAKPKQVRERILKPSDFLKGGGL